MQAGSICLAWARPRPGWGGLAGAEGELAGACSWVKGSRELRRWLCRPEGVDRNCHLDGHSAAIFIAAFGNQFLPTTVRIKTINYCLPLTAVGFYSFLLPPTAQSPPSSPSLSVWEFLLILILIHQHPFPQPPLPVQTACLTPGLLVSRPTGP